MKVKSLAYLRSNSSQILIFEMDIAKAAAKPANSFFQYPMPRDACKRTSTCTVTAL